MRNQRSIAKVIILGCLTFNGLLVPVRADWNWTAKPTPDPGCFSTLSYSPSDDQIGYWGLVHDIYSQVFDTYYNPCSDPVLTFSDCIPEAGSSANGARYNSENFVSDGRVV